MDRGGLGKIGEVILAGAKTSGQLWRTSEASEERTGYFLGINKKGIPGSGKTRVA